jgi:hypothetical protein
LPPDPQHVCERETLGRDLRRERRAFDQLHRDEVHAVRLLEGMQRDDGVVIERGNGFGFPREPFKVVRSRFEPSGQHFDGDRATQLEILGCVI